MFELPTFCVWTSQPSFTVDPEVFPHGPPSRNDLTEIYFLSVLCFLLKKCSNSYILCLLITFNIHLLLMPSLCICNSAFFYGSHSTMDPFGSALTLCLECACFLLSLYLCFFFLSILVFFLSLSLCFFSLSLCFLCLHFSYLVYISHHVCVFSNSVSAIILCMYLCARVCFIFLQPSCFNMTYCLKSVLRLLVD